MMGRRYSGWVRGVLAGAFCAVGARDIQAPAADLKAGMPQHLEVYAHRGGAGLAPENTLAAFRRALELGVDAMETDLHVTRDGEIVAIHDETVDRTTDGRGSVADLTLDELRRWDAGAKFAPAFRGERIPTLRDVIDLVKASGNPRVRLILEIKFPPDRPGEPEEFEERVLEVLRQTGFVPRVTIVSFYHPSLAKLKTLEPRIPTGVLAGGRRAPLDPIALVRQYRADYYSPSVRHVTAEGVAALHRAGIPVVPWTANEEAEMRRLMALGIGTRTGDGITTDYPDRLLALLKALH